MTTINVNLTVLKALLHSAGDKDIRYYLNGVKVEATRKETRCIATDGHMVTVHKDKGSSEIPADVLHEFTIPRDVIKSLVVNKKQPYAEVTPGVFAAAGSTELAIKYQGETRVIRSVDGKFPEYQRVIPLECNGEAATFNPALLVRITKLFKELRGGKGWYGLMYNGQSGAVAHDGRDDLITVIMPMRHHHENFDVRTLSWARDSIKPVPAKMAA